MKNTGEDAVANVVVMLLILAVIVLAFAAISTVYLPSLKETAELQHSETVKSAFMHFSADVDSVYARGQLGIHSQIISLGGGDILFSPSKSSGTLKAESIPLPAVITFTCLDSTPVYFNNTCGSTDTSGGTERISLNTVALSYTPHLGIRENQEYTYTKGVVWVGRNNVYTPVSSVLYTVEDGIGEQDSTVRRWILTVRPHLVGSNMTLYHDNLLNPDEITGYDNYYVYSLTLVNFTVNPSAGYLSGNGDAELRITVDIESETEYTLRPGTSLDINGDTVFLQQGTVPTRLRITVIRAEVSIR